MKEYEVKEESHAKGWVARWLPVLVCISLLSAGHTAEQQVGSSPRPAPVPDQIRALSPADFAIPPQTVIRLDKKQSDQRSWPIASETWFKFHISETQVRDVSLVYCSVPDASIESLARDSLMTRVLIEPKLPATESWYYHRVVILGYTDSTEIDTANAPLPDDFGAVTCASVTRMADITKISAPKYPKHTLAQGNVMVEVHLDEQGEVIEARVFRSSMDADLDSAAVKSAFKCKYTPFVVCGKPRSCWVAFPVVFELEP